MQAKYIIVLLKLKKDEMISPIPMGGEHKMATRVTELASERRREEIARMLAGAEITNEARAAAERLIKAAS
jgi:DNA repair protein RecN (Recombination protein N)